MSADHSIGSRIKSDDREGDGQQPAELPTDGDTAGIPKEVMNFP